MPDLRPLLVPLAVLLALSGCSSDDDQQEGSAESGRKTWTLSYESAEPVALADQVGPVELDGNRVLFAYRDAKSGPADRLGVKDLATGRRIELARTAFRGGSIIAVAAVGGQVVYIDESARGDLDPGAARWRVRLVGSDRVLASSGTERVTMSPDLTAIDGAAVWTVYPDEPGDPGARVRAFGWEPGGQVQERDALPGDEQECVPPATDQQLVGGCDHRNGWFAWVERSSAVDDMVDQDNPGTMYAARDDRGSRRVVTQVDSDLGGPVIFDQFLLRSTDDGEVEVISLEHPEARVVVVPRDDDVPVYFGRGDDARSLVISEDPDGTHLVVLEPGEFRLKGSTGHQ